TGGGNYVQISQEVPKDTDLREFSFWVKNVPSDHITIRLIDGADRCHQFNLRTTPGEGWQRIVFPVEQFFANQGKASALKIVSKYEAWGGPKDQTGKWTGPAKLVVILIGKQNEANPVANIWFNSIAIVPKPAGAAETKGVLTTVPLDEVIEGEHFWDYVDGREFPGAKGSLTAVKDQPEDGKYAMELKGDFSGGGLYVAAAKRMEDLALQDIKEIRLKYKTDTVKSVGIRLGDGSGQTHQKKNVPLTADGQWHELVLKPAEIAGGEHWGGANDGKWKGAPKYVSIGIGKPESEGGSKSSSLLIADVKASALVSASSGEVAWQAPFEGDSAAAAKDWATKGAVKVDETDAFKGKQSLVLEKTDATLRENVTAAGPAFPVRPGTWEIQFAAKSDLTSMDNSYNGSLRIEFLDASGKVVGSSELATLFRKNGWKPIKKQVEAPASAASARFVAGINKETPGRFWIDELSAAPIVTERKDDNIRRLMFTTAQVGNLLFPEDSREIIMEVWASKPLPEAQRKVSVTVRDYWGAEQAASLTAELQRDGRKDTLFRYTAKVDLKPLPLEIGRYYELHASIDRRETEPFTNFTSLAILPEAPANAYKPEEIPFTSRNWDNRITEYVKLTKRLGVRICGVWGSMSDDPAKVSAPQLDLIETLGMGYLTGSPAHSVEQRANGWQDLLANDGAKIRKGVQNYVAKYGKVKPMIVNLGNEPHAKGEDVKVDVEAYRIVYQELKKIDPSIYVVGTSVFQEDYFKYGFGEWCDAYDFHVYEDALSVRKTVGERYPEMFRKYGFPKPVWSTELGLNSQGMARQFVAAEVYRKFVNFFAGGGANVSWFGLLYPDTDGKNAESFGSAHNVFDCRYNKYAPKLDAIAYFNAVNSIAIKKYVQDKVFGAGVHAFLFRDRDDKALQIWYTEKGREDLFIPLPGVNEVQVVRIDGTRSTLFAGDKGITLTVTEDPILLQYVGGAKQLPASTTAPEIALRDAPPSLVRGEKTQLGVLLNAVDPSRISLKAPPFWQVTSQTQTLQSQKVLTFSLNAPEQSNVREAEMVVQLMGADGKPNGEIYYRPAVTGTLSLQMLPVPALTDADGKVTRQPAVKVLVQNNSPNKQRVNWDVALGGEQSLKGGVFTRVEPTSAYFTEAASGSLEIEGKQSASATLPLADADLYKVYRGRATVRDATGRVTAQERPLSAFYPVPKARTAVSIDGVLDEADWKDAPVRKLDKMDQFYAFVVKDKQTADWTGPEDLSAEIRYLWDAKYFYVSVKIKDDIAGKVIQKDSGLWQQDGLQFLIDPMRTSAYKVGKYEYSLGLGTEGPQTWCTLSADGAAPAGNAPEVKLAIKRDKEGTGDTTYEIAFPWSRLAPFKPAPGNNLGFTLIVNEDDGAGRNAFMTWFGNAHSKDIDTVGDLILGE
ncbi:MAG: sugar-binding protein, partial [Candidatus Methylacidiphilales bacterium]